MSEMFFLVKSRFSLAALDALVAILAFFFSSDLAIKLLIFSMASALLES